MLEATISVGLLVALLLIGLPMLVAIMSAVILNFLLAGSWGVTLPQMMLSGMSLFLLLALPMFILAGGIMNAGGISGRLFEFARASVGWMRGGLAQVDVVLSIFFGGMVGSSSADLAGTGTIVIPALKREGYPAEFAASVSASSSGIGPLIPPSSPMILYSAITGTSLGALFLAGLIPGLLLGFVLMVVVAVIARRRGWKPFAPFLLEDFFYTLKRSILSFGMPILLVVGLTVGIFTPTEGAAFAVAYAIVLSCFIYRSLSFRQLYRVMGNAVQLTGELTLIVSLSFALGSGFASLHVPDAIGHLIEAVDFGDSQFLVLLLLMGLAVIAGMFLDPLIPVLVPIILPTLLAYDIDLIHFGVLMVMAVVIGQLTPPLAIALIITSRIAGVDQMKIFRANMPFFIVIILFTLVLMAVPIFSTWLPSIAQ
jgi:tripartite ATP-independent transporter DctM subunit